VATKRLKLPRAPRRRRKKEEVEVATEEAPKEEAAAEETPKPVETEAVTDTEAAAPVVEAVTEGVKEVKEEVSKPLKVGRRLSARVGDFFKSKPKAEVAPPAKVDEHTPKIDEPVPVAPLENPASEGAEAKVEQSANPVEAVAPVVAATA